MSQIFNSASTILTALENSEKELSVFIEEEKRQMVRARQLRKRLDKQRKRIEVVNGRLPEEVKATLMGEESHEEEVMQGGGDDDKENVGSRYNNTSKVPCGEQKRNARITEDKNTQTTKSAKNEQRKEHTSSKESSADTFIEDVNDDELKRTPSYVKGRLKLDKVNFIVGKLNAIATDKYKLLSKSRSMLTSADFDKLADYEEGNCEETEGSRFITDADIKASGELRMNSDTKGAINVLRHIRSVKEVRGKNKMRIFLLR